MEEMVANPAVETTPGIRASGKDNARSHHPAEENPVIGLLKNSAANRRVCPVYRRMGINRTDTRNAPYILPKPSDIAAAAAENSANLITSVSTTIVEALIGFTISVVLGISLAILLALSKTVEKAYIPTLLSYRLFRS